MTELIILIWIVGSILVGYIGTSYKHGFLVSMIMSLILSPIIGLIFTLLSKSNGDLDFEKQMLNLQKENSEYLSNVLYEIQDIKNNIEMTYEEDDDINNQAQYN